MRDKTNRLNVHLDFAPKNLPGLDEAAKREVAGLLRDFIALRSAMDELRDQLPDEPPAPEHIDAVAALMVSLQFKYLACDEAAQRLCHWFRDHDPDHNLVLRCDGRLVLYTSGSIVCIDGTHAVDVSGS